MKAPLPLLLITVLQGLSGGMAVAIAVRLNVGGTVAVWPLGLALVLALIGGAASFTHMHQIQAGRYMLRGWRTSWLSREALTTAWFIAALFAEGLWRFWGWNPAGLPAWSVATALFGLLAMWVTAMVYATIPAMRSWHSPLTVLSMMGTGLLGGWMVMLMLWPRVRWETAVALAALGLFVAVRALQMKFFADARKGVLAATGTGLPRPPYRLQDTGTTKPPYRTQTQTGPELTPAQRHRAWLGLAIFMVVVPVMATIFALNGRAAEVFSVVRALSIVVGSFTERWLFFRDSTHSSRVWFQDQSFGQRGTLKSRRVSS